MICPFCREAVKILPDQLIIIIKNLKFNNISYKVGEFNITIGIRHRSDLQEKYSLGKNYEKKEMLLEFYQKHNMVVRNTCRQLHQLRLNSQKNPGDNLIHIIKNRID